MIVALFALAAAMMIGGIASVIQGFPFVRLESGLAMTIAGATVASAGAVLFGLAAAIRALKHVEQALSFRQLANEIRPDTGTAPVPAGPSFAPEPAVAAPPAAPARTAGLAGLAGLGGLAAGLAAGRQPKEAPGAEPKSEPRFEDALSAARSSAPAEPTFPELALPEPLLPEPSPQVEPYGQDAHHETHHAAHPAAHEAEPEIRSAEEPELPLPAPQDDDAHAKPVAPPQEDDDLFVLPELPAAHAPEPEEAPALRPAIDAEPIAAQPPQPLENPALAEHEAAQGGASEPVHEPLAQPSREVVGTYASGGNTYVMFSDGAIEAETPQGRFTFGSLDELKRFVDGGGEAGRGAA